MNKQSIIKNFGSIHLQEFKTEKKKVHPTNQEKVKKDALQEQRLNNVKEIELPRIKMKIKDKVIEALVDTGATCSFIKKVIADLLEFNQTIECNNSVLCGNSTLEKITGSVKVVLVLDDEEIPGNFSVMNLTEEMIIGWDLIKMLKIEIKPSTGKKNQRQRNYTILPNQNAY